jgi:hypothetical protein
VILRINGRSVPQDIREYNHFPNALIFVLMVSHSRLLASKLPSITADIDCLIIFGALSETPSRWEEPEKEDAAPTIDLEIGRILPTFGHNGISF